tara:strand:+ start:124 stop:633 length:510 start_codon:yes stop_codon:yes gene_type:complete
MTTDVKQAHINLSGFLVLGRNRVRALSYVGTATAGTLVLFDTATAPVTSGVTYGRTSTTVTVTKTSHGLVTGDTVGIHFEGFPSATDGNYVITRVDANNFTLTDINTGSITGSPAAVYVSGGGSWLLTYESSATDIFNNSPDIPEDGVLAIKGVYAYMTDIAVANIYYG